MALKAGSEDAAASKDTRTGAPPTGKNVTPETFLTAVRDITSLAAIVKNANENLKAARKRHKGNGIELKILDEAVRMTEWSRGEVREYLGTRSRYYELMGLPVGHTMDMFKTTPDHVVQQVEAEALGKTAGLLGKPARPPEDLGAEFHTHWLRGHASADDSLFEESETGRTPGGEEEEDVRPDFLKAKTAETEKHDTMLDPPGPEDDEEQDDGTPKDLEEQLEDALAATDKADNVSPLDSHRLAKARVEKAKAKAKGLH